MKTYHISAAALLLLASLGGAEEKNHKSYSGEV